MSDTAVTPSTATFDQFGLAPDILKAVKESGYTIPTPIQAQAIPVVLAGRDVMGAAQTGTGKTASFSLPIIQRLLPQASTSASPARHPVRALILTPTRELADQVAANVQSYAKHTALRSAVVFGGVDMNPQSEQLRRGVEILIATPGRLLDHVQQKTANLGQVQILVLDEADRMLDMGFLPDLQRILNLLPKERQTLLFSATFSGEIKKLAATYLRDPQTIEVARSNSTATNVTQIVFEVPEGDKTGAVVQLIRERSLKQVIVFCNSKIGASRLARSLERDGVIATAIHGDRSQNERMQALDAFKRGEIEALVATDVAARGLDIAELPAVINFDLPFNAEDYVHRIGRTGRAGASGDALSLCSPNERKQLADIEKLIKRPLEVQRLTVDTPVRHHHEERAPRRERSEVRDERGGRRRSGAPSGSFDRPHHHRAQPVDDFFLKPYEPSPASVRKIEEADAASAAPQKTSAKQPLAALLGGFGMPRKSSS
ncbi:DEAD/DEAH box helicase [Paraburkholderia sp. 22099]|jgi:superfamily II DNA/RNA helicase|uniref:DEAD-box ATP-dependent RNA helicase RhpA n=1 Tax=Paraburkholderia terricola TaxID=169427 RepID=A0A1M6QCJ4_9BURK|nr:MULTISPECIES: DEAD/DEAH box helicase [Paraburkholderia]ORC47043.1 DEAD/DEAH box helicase [Burkholderia sp. A27]MDR6411337.1 superfamily II DNA/RNA helicase [Paraburkholderia terricola]MDR6445670.1 superfamily II DNA/RNA helicase [Paraburkholderia terricola]MDR6483423.1 superfamily II DNA/RNA helicase [Paraburkholderia terricola]MDR6493468.1 superfamily II DNA/RNA helicase [Paraburkholderia terricola]